MDQVRQLLMRPRVLLIGGGILLLILIPLVLVSLRGASQRVPSSVPSQQLPQTASSGTLPLLPSDPAVQSAVVSYVLKGTVQEVRTSGSGTFLMLAIPGSAVPPLPLSSRSKIKVRRPAGSVDVTVANLTQGSPVNIHALFDVSKRTWSVLLVEITR